MRLNNFEIKSNWSIMGVTPDVRAFQLGTWWTLRFFGEGWGNAIASEINQQQSHVIDAAGCYCCLQH
jgi:hypothetical protein